MLGRSTPQARRVAHDYLLLILQQAIGSSTHLVAQHVLTQLAPVATLFWRSLFAAVAALGWLVHRSHASRLLRLSSFREKLLLLLLGALAVPLNQWCFLAGVRRTAAANASLLYALTPLWTLLLSWAGGQERPTLRKVLGIGCALIGTAFVLFEKELRFGAEHVVGNLLLLCASVAWAAFTVLSQRLSLRYGASAVTACSMFTGWLLYLPLWLLNGAPTQLQQLHALLWAELLYMGLITSGVGYLLWLLPLRHMEASRVAVFSTLQPILTTLAAIPLFGFAPSAAFILGGMLILAGVVVTQME